MDIFRAEKIAQNKMAEAKDDNWDKQFFLLGKEKIITCKWLDPYMGIFQIEGEIGFARTEDVPAGVECLMSED